MKRTDLLSRLYELFEPVSNSSPQFKKKIVFVADSGISASPVTMVKARRTLGIRCERIAGRPAWHAPTVSLNIALRYGADSASALLARRKRKSDRMAERLVTSLRSFMVDHGLAVPYYEIMDKFKKYRIEMQVGRGFSYTAFSGAVRLLQLEKVVYKGLRYYLLKQRGEDYDPAFSELTQLVDDMFNALPDRGKTISEKKILEATSAYSPAAVLHIDGYVRKDGMWHIEGRENLSVKHMDKSLDPSRKKIGKTLL
jgi:hypothetical protein